MLCWFLFCQVRLKEVVGLTLLEIMWNLASCLFFSIVAVIRIVWGVKGLVEKTNSFWVFYLESGAYQF